MSLPLVSAICVTRNRPRFLRRAVELFKAQTYPNKELVIVADGPYQDLKSGDGIHYAHLDRPVNFAEAHCFGFKRAYGRYLCTWDDDDWHGPERIEREVAALAAGPCDIVGCVPILLLLPECQFAVWSAETVRAWHRDGMGWLPFHDGTAMWRREWTDGLRVPAQQMEFMSSMYNCGAKFGAVPNDGLFIYVRHQGTQWQIDAAAKSTPVERPGWVTDEMMAFWQSEEVMA